MKKTYKKLFAIVAVVLAFAGCKKTTDVTPPEVQPPVVVVDTVKALKDATDIPIGVAISYTPMINDATYKATVLRDFDGVTFDYNMKHGAIVQNDGSLNFANADALVNAAAGLQVFGHALGWHQNQNASYLKTFSGLSGSVTGNELITNGGFEAGLTGWSAFNTNGGATIIATNVTNEIHAGAGAIKVTVPTAYPGSQWNVQLSSTAFATTVGKQYAISYWVKAASAGGSIRLSTGPGATNAQYQGRPGYRNSVATGYLDYYSQYCLYDHIV
jgi:endo-1,4-beta-xylanase